MWGVAFVETRCADSLVGSGGMGWGTLVWGLFHFGHQDCPFPNPPSPMEPPFLLCPCIYPHSAMLSESGITFSGEREER